MTLSATHGLMDAVKAATKPQLSLNGACYIIAGREVPRVTHILQEAGLIDFSHVPPETLEQAAWRGSAVHQTCWFDDEGDLDERTVPEEAKPYLACWRQAKELLGWESSRCEPLLCDPNYLFAGRPDRIWRGVVLDLKTGEVLPSAHWQTAAYARLAGVARRIIVRLRPDGSPRIIELKLSDLGRDYSKFAAALTLWWTRKEYDLL